MPAILLAWAGLSLCVAAAPQGPASTRAGLRRLARAYGRSRAGRRLEGRLAAAQLTMSPPTWRATQLMVWVPASLAVSLFGAGPAASAALGASAVRLGSGAVLRARSGRRAEALAAAVPVLARRLAAELGRGLSLGEALVGPVGGGSDPASASLVATLAGHSRLGGDPAAALLARAAGEPGAAAAAMRRLAGAIALVSRGAGPVPLRRLADSLDQRRSLRRQATAGLAEARWSAVLVPLIALGALALLLAGQPSAAAAALSPIGVAVLGGCAAVSGAGVLVARRLTVV